MVEPTRSAMRRAAPLAVWTVGVALSALVSAGPLWRSAQAAGLTGIESTATAPAHPTPWEYSAYRVSLFIKIDPSDDWPPKRRADLIADIEHRTRSVVGGLWRLKASEVPADVRWNSAAEISHVATDRLPPTVFEADKVMLLGLANVNGKTSFLVREFDVRTQSWGAALTAEPRKDGELADQIVRALWQCFSPIVRIDQIADRGVVTCRIRGGALSPVDHSLEIMRPGTVLKPIIRHYDAQGKTAPDGLFPVAWTWLRVEQADGPTATCRLVSGVQDPIDLHYDGRTEYLALAVATRERTSTDLIVRARGDDRPLEDVEVFARDSDMALPRLVGRTDEKGAVRVESPQVAAPMLYLRSGNDLLVKLPVVPGLEPRITVSVEDNGRRLETGDLVARASDELIDLVAQQALLKTRLQRELVAGRIDEAGATMGILKQLKTSDSFLKSLDARRRALPDLAGDPVAVAWLEKRLGEVKPLAAKLLSSEDLTRLQDLLDKKRAAQQASGAVKTP